VSFDLTNFLTNTVITGTAFGVLGWVSRTAIQQWLSQSLASYKSDLERRGQVEIERLRAQLQVAAASQGAKLASLHERQAEVISEVFSRLEVMHLAFRRWVARMRPVNQQILEQGRLAQVAYSDFIDYYYRHAIWLDRDTTQVINGIIEDLWAVTVDMSLDVNENGFPRDREAWNVANRRVTETIPQVRTALDTKFREILGVEPGTLVLPALPPSQAPDQATQQ